jgi:hypothetical protein
MRSFRTGSLAFLFALLAAMASGADLATVVFSSDDTGSFPKTVNADRRSITVDLSGLGKGVAVVRAVLRPHADINPRYGREKPEPVALTLKGSEEPLPLLPPRYRGFLCTRPVADAVKAGTAKITLLPLSLRGYKGQGAHLEVTCTVKCRKPIPPCSNVRSWHESGQTFLVWEQPKITHTPDSLTSEQYLAFRKTLAAKARYAFRIYRHAKPITAHNIAEAELVDEVGPLTCWNTEHQQARYTLRRKYKLLRYVLTDGEKPVPPGTGIYAHNPARPGKAWYAVSTVRNGEEDLSRLPTVGPVEEIVGPGAPVLQFVKKPGEYKHHFYQKKATLYYYTRWEAPPRCNLPSRPIDYIVGILPNTKPPSPLALRLHGWGGSMHGGGFWTFPHLGTILISTNQIPYDWWTGYHEFKNTWRGWNEGAVSDYTQQRLLGIVDWVDTKWKVDKTRVSVGGGSMGGSGTTNLAVHHHDRIAFCAGSVGVHIPDSSPQFTGSYEHNYGRVAWKLPYKDTGIPAFDWFSNEWYVLNRPKADLGLICFSNGKNDGQIGWPQAVRFARALQKTRQPHVFKWGLSGHGEGVFVPPCAAGCRTDRTLPAFSRCSLDEDPGKLVRRPREEYRRLKKEAREYHEKTGKWRHVDPYDGDSHGMFNGYLRWDTTDEGIVDEPKTWSMIVWLSKGDRRGRYAAPKDTCAVDITPRRCQAFRPEPGGRFHWSNLRGTPQKDGGIEWTEVQTGQAAADEHGLVTLKQVKVTKAKHKIVVKAKE